MTTAPTIDPPRQWVDTTTGEIYEGPCPNCAERAQWAEDQVRALEMEKRALRTKVTKAERAAEHATMAKRDGAVWQEALSCWLAHFPHKKPSGVGIKSARATKFFQRLETGATLLDVQDAIRAAKVVPYIVYGRRVKAGSKADLSDDLEQIVSVGNDAQFDRLVEIGRELRAAEVPT